MASPQGKTPASFADGVNAAMQDLAAAMAAPDADLHFGTEVIKLLGTFIQSKHAPQQSPAPGGGGQTPPGAGAPPGMSTPGGPAGGGAQNPAMRSMQPPSGPSQPGSGPTPGLTPNPDEMRRVMQEVAGQ